MRRHCAAPPYRLIAIAGVLAMHTSVMADSLGTLSRCSELTALLDQLHAHIALVEAELGSMQCTRRTNRTGVPGSAAAAVASPSTGDVSPVRRVDPPTPSEGEGNNGAGAGAAAHHCWAANSSVTDPACNCLGEDPPPKLSSRPTIKVGVGGWYACRRHSTQQAQNAQRTTRGVGFGSHDDRNHSKSVSYP